MYAAVNQLKGPKEVVVLPLSDHKGVNNSQQPYRTREAKARAALLATGVLDVNSGKESNSPAKAPEPAVPAR